MRTARDALSSLDTAGRNGRLDDLCHSHSIDLVSVFGSVLNSAVEAPADLDVGVRFLETSQSDLVAVTTNLIEMLRFDNVDVLDVGHAGVVARGRALGAGARGIYEREAGLYARASMAAMTMEMDTAYLRRLDVELLAGR